jgi:hypothetical protein
MKRILNPTIKDFDTFYDALVQFVHLDKPCFSVQSKKEYQSWMEGKVIYMSGEDRQKSSIYPKPVLKHVFDIIKNETDIKTKMLDPAVKRERSPILALMVASKAVISKL